VNPLFFWMHRSGDFNVIRILRKTLLAAGTVVFACFATSPVHAQAWPARPVRIIVPFAAGGTSDNLGRIVAQKLSETLKQPFVVENRGGASGSIGSEMVARAAPDGYTLVVSGVASHVVVTALSKVPYDPIKDFTHIALFGGPPSVFAVNPSVPARDLKEFVALAKASPGKYAYASPGTGSHGHLVGEVFKKLAGIDITHVPYKGGGPATADLIAGHVPALSTTLSSAATQIRAGKARGLAVSSAARLPDHPDIPTFREMGYPELVATIWFGLSGPAGLPPDIVQRLNAEVRRALQSPDVRERLHPEGIEPGTLDPQQYTAFIAEELKRWVPILRATGATAN
jgi:tripartite-type tricarboxylate transporter receptor subunit TctC